MLTISVTEPEVLLLCIFYNLKRNSTFPVYCAQTVCLPQKLTKGTSLGCRLVPEMISIARSCAIAQMFGEDLSFIMLFK